MKNIIIFTDGSCIGNGQSDAIGGIGIHFPNQELEDISKIYRSGDNCTNQKTELYAILYALRYVNKYLGLKNYNILIYSDSDYSINCITKWTNGWIRNGWLTKNKTPVANRELIQKIYNYYTKYNIQFQHIEAHTGLTDKNSIANAVADELARKASERAIREKKIDNGQVLQTFEPEINIDNTPIVNNKPRKSYNRSRQNFNIANGEIDYRQPIDVELI